MVQIHSVYKGTSSKLERYSSIWGRLHKWTHSGVPDNRSDLYWIHQVPFKYKAHPYQFCAGPVYSRFDRPSKPSASIDRMSRGIQALRNTNFMNFILTSVDIH